MSESASVPAPLPDPPVATLRCRECGEAAPADGPQYCGWCFGPVEVLLPAAGADAEAVHRAIAAGQPSLARYGPLLPGGIDLAGSTVGWTPLRRAEALGAEVGLADLWVKDETANPSGSFKARVVEVAAARAGHLGARVLACSSTGNLARAVADAATRRGMASVVLVPEGLPADEVADLVGRGALVVAVRGGYDAASRLAAEAAADLDTWGWVNVTLRPWYELGGRTVGFEVAEQLGWHLPDRLVVPMASGALARALHDAAVHLSATGLANGPAPRLTAVQPAGCAGVAAAFAGGSNDPVPVRQPQTVAASLAMGDPPDGPAVLAAARATGGAVVAAAEEAIAPAVERLRRTEALAAEPAGGVVVAALADLVERGVVDPDERVVAVITGAPPRVRPAGDDGTGVPGPGPAGTIEPSVRALTALLPSELRRRAHHHVDDPTRTIT